MPIFAHQKHEVSQLLIVSVVYMCQINEHSCMKGGRYTLQNWPGDITDIAGNFCQEKSIVNFTTWSCWRKFYSSSFLSCVSDYIEHMATFTIMTKISNIPAIQRYLGLA